jgi:hypothetical protein
VIGLPGLYRYAYMSSIAKKCNKSLLLAMSVVYPLALDVHIAICVFFSLGILVDYSYVELI